jgi:hypothetical protein
MLTMVNANTTQWNVFFIAVSPDSWIAELPAQAVTDFVQHTATNRRGEQEGICKNSLNIGLPMQPAEQVSKEMQIRDFWSPSRTRFTSRSPW